MAAELKGTLLGKLLADLAAGDKAPDVTRLFGSRADATRPFGLRPIRRSVEAFFGKLKCKPAFVCVLIRQLPVGTIAKWKPL